MWSLISLILVNNLVSDFNCNNYNFIPIQKSSLKYNSEYCPTTDNIDRLKNCISANENEFCYTEGECNLNKNLNNCGYANNKQYSVYVKQVKTRKLQEWHTVSKKKDRYYVSQDKRIFGCVDENDLLSENGFINYNPLIGLDHHLPLKTNKECETYCLNSKDNLGRKCLGYGWGFDIHSGSTKITAACKLFYKCDTYKKYDFNNFKTQMGMTSSTSYYSIYYTIRKAIFHEVETTSTTNTVTTKTATSKTRTSKTATSKTKTFTTKTTTSKTVTSKTKTSITNTFTTNTKTTITNTKTTTTTKTTITNTITSKTSTSKTNTLTTKTTIANTLTSKITTSNTNTLTTSTTILLVTNTKTPQVITKKSINKDTTTKKTTNTMIPITVTSTTTIQSQNNIMNQIINNNKKHKNTIIILILILIIIIIILPIGIYIKYKCKCKNTIPPQNNMNNMNTYSIDNNNHNTLTNPMYDESPI
jgi:hypothetical protein